MQSYMRHLLLIACFLTGIGAAWGQVTSYPYTENFDAFPFNNTFTSPYFEPNVLPSNWVNEQAGDPFQDWYGRTIPTATGGTGPDADHTTGSGVYLYVEDNIPNDHDSVILYTPQFDFTGLVNPTLRYWVHSNHAGGGSPVAGVNHLLVEVNTGSGWTQVDSVGHLGASWVERIVALPTVAGILEMRLVVNNNNGTNTHDIAIDDFELIDPPAFDLVLSNPAVGPTGYTQIPASQRFAFQANVFNGGGSGLTNVQLKAEVAGFADSTSLASLAPGDDSLLSVDGFIPGLPGTYTANLTGSVAENDTFPANDTASVSFAVSDTILARDDSSFINGIGFTGAAGAFGQAFTLTEQDTLTSVSVFLNNPTPGGDPFRVLIYTFNGVPIQLLDSTNTLTTQTGTNWYTLQPTCPLVLPPGDYFLAADQLATNNLAMGYTDQIYTPDITYFTTDFVTWTAFETVPFEVTLLLRMNLGKVPGVQLTIDNAPLCEGDSAVILASGSDNYLWDGQSLGDSVIFTPGGDTTLVVTATSAAGCASSDTLDVVFNPLPEPGLPDTVSVCPGGSTTVAASGGGSYLWSTGDTTASIDVTATTSSPLTVAVTSAQGCEALASAPIVEAPAPDAGLPDTSEVVCFGEELTLLASNGVSYLWSTGATGSTLTVTPTTGTSYRVEVTNADGCQGEDSTFVPVNTEITGIPDASPAINGQPTGQAWVVMNGGTPPYQFAWQDAAQQTDSVAEDLPPGTYTVLVTDAAGCTAQFEVTVDNLTSIEAARAKGLRAYPNPTTGAIRLEVSERFGAGPWYLTLHDKLGRVVGQWQPGAASVLALALPADLPAGAYLLRVRSEQAQGTLRLWLTR